MLKWIRKFEFDWSILLGFFVICAMPKTAKMCHHSRYFQNFRRFCHNKSGEVLKFVARQIIFKSVDGKNGDDAPPQRSGNFLLCLALKLKF